MTLGWALVVALALFMLIAAAVLRLRVASVSALQERMSRPPDLRDAEVAYVEQTFRAERPLAIAARIDRAYRLPSNEIVLVELKTRWHTEVHLSDVVQLSAQAAAVEGDTGETVSRYAYVAIALPATGAAARWHRVELLSNHEVAGLARRREELLQLKLAPRYAESIRRCRSCAFLTECDAPSHRR